MFFAIVGNFVAVFCDGYGYLVGNRIDLELSVYYLELYVREVRGVEVLEVCSNDTHVVCSSICLGYCPCSGLSCLDSSCYVILGIVRYHCLVALDGVFLAIVGNFVTVLCDSYGYLVSYRTDCQLALCDSLGAEDVILAVYNDYFAGILDGLGLALHRNCNCFVGKSHRIFAGVCSCSRSLYGICNCYVNKAACICCALACSCNGVSLRSSCCGVALFSAVISLCSSVSCYSNIDGLSPYCVEGVGRSVCCVITAKDVLDSIVAGLITPSDKCVSFLGESAGRKSYFVVINA